MQYSNTPEFWERFASSLSSIARQTARAIQIGPSGGMVLDKVAAGGDLQTVADEAAGARIRELLTRSEIPLALLDEATGEFQPLHENPVIGLIVDELDGTRPARMGMPTCCVSIAAYPLDQPALLRNVMCGAIVRLDTEADYVFVRDCGVWRCGKRLVTTPDATTFDTASVWLEEAMVHTGLHGLYNQDFMPHTRHGAVRMGSVCYGGLLMVEGGVHILTHLSLREYKAWPEVRPLINAIWGPMTSICTYDVAALVPLLWECGFSATDAWGEPLVHLFIDKSGPGFEVPGLIAASNVNLHRETTRRLNEREQLLLDHSPLVAQILEL